LSDAKIYIQDLSQKQKKALRSAIQIGTGHQPKCNKKRYGRKAAGSDLWLKQKNQTSPITNGKKEGRIFGEKRIYS